MCINIIVYNYIYNSGSESPSGNIKANGTYIFIYFDTFLNYFLMILCIYNATCHICRS